MWHQVLSFFRWTHKEMNSESQVRLYVNPKLGRWGAWAFPQVARTGMSAREMPTPETPEKAQERFASWQSEPSDDWLYFGTVHHHCSASAFQARPFSESDVSVADIVRVPQRYPSGSSVSNQLVVALSLSAGRATASRWASGRSKAWVYMGVS
jgi:hypothetical protein